MKDNIDSSLKTMENIKRQVERWDFFAKLAPTIFLLTSFVLLFFEIIGFDLLFKIGMTLFSFTAVVWWFWTIFSIRNLVTIMRRATENLISVGEDLKIAKIEYQELRNEENNRR